MHFIAFSCKEWKPNSLGRYGINSSASKTCFVTAMFAHMLRLIIQNRFHLLLKYFSIRNSLSDVPSAPLFVDAVSIFVACAVEFQVGVLAPEDFSVSNLPLRGLTIRRSCVCCSVCMRNGLRFTDSKHCFADDEKTALREYLVFEIVSVECCLETKIRRAVKLLYDVIADTIRYIQVKMRAASLQLAKTPTQFARFARDKIIKLLRSALREELQSLGHLCFNSCCLRSYGLCVAL